MAKFTVTRLLETAQILATPVGQAIPGFFDYMADFVQQTAKALRLGLTFADNFACEVKTVSLTNNTAQIISASKVVTGIIPVRVISQSIGLDSFAWYYDDNGRLTVRARFIGETLPVSYEVTDTDAVDQMVEQYVAPPTGAHDVVLVILF